MYYTRNRTTPISIKSRRRKFSRNSGEPQKHDVVGEEDSPVILPGLGRQRGRVGDRKKNIKTKRLKKKSRYGLYCDYRPSEGRQGTGRDGAFPQSSNR
jgi:hypothetical protein